MELQEQFKEHDVVDYSFMFPTGSKLNVTIDLTLGDSIENLNEKYVVVLKGKPSLTDPDETIDPEEIVVFKQSLAAVSATFRKQRQPTEEELFNMRKFVHQIAKQTM